MMQWTTNTREDGLAVEDLGTSWAIVVPYGFTMLHCPCCGKTMPDAEKARLVADRLYPHKLLKID